MVKVSYAEWRPSIPGPYPYPRKQSGRAKRCGSACVGGALWSRSFAKAAGRGLKALAVPVRFALVVLTIARSARHTRSGVKSMLRDPIVALKQDSVRLTSLRRPPTSACDALTNSRRLSGHEVVDVKTRLVHRLAAGAFAATLGTIVLIAGLTGANSAASSVPGTSVAHVKIRLLASGVYTGNLSVVNGRIVVGDETGATVCRITSIDPAALRVVSNRSANCTDPSISGETVMPIVVVPTPRSRFGFVKIATRNATSGAIHVGPVVLRFAASVSDARPQWTYGAGYLWIFASGSTSSGATTGRPSEVLRISLTTGQLVSKVSVPFLNRVELAANNDGLWMARSQETTATGTALVYFIGANAGHTRIVVKRGDYAAWLAASGHSAWATLLGYSGSGIAEVATFSSPTAKPRTTPLTANAYVPIESGQELFDAEPVLVDPGKGLLFIATVYPKKGPPAVSTKEIFKFNPTTGRETKIASIETSVGSFQAGLVYQGDLYFLNGGQSLDASVYRIRP